MDVQDAEHQTVDVYKRQVLKKEKDTDRVLAGGVFGLYTSDDIKNAKGEVLLKKDSLIEQRVTEMCIRDRFLSATIASA